jgi:type II secretory pathway component GspD/PulD (secretin)
MKEIPKRVLRLAHCSSFFFLLYSPFAYTADIDENLIAAAAKIQNVNVDKDTYTVNFNNVSIIEFIRFASKITNLNFVFEEGDLQFSVTVVSEEAVSAKSVMAALSQVLRMHNLTLLEQDGNVLITTSKAVNQIPPIISSDLPDSKANNAALVTRVFRLKNANVNTIAGIIRPMCSSAALIEVSVETRQLIVTDITTNVEQIDSLLASLDAPHTPLDVETYTVKNIPPQELIALTQQILTPFSEGNPLIFVPQNDTNSVFVVSTPHLLERAIAVMEDLDMPSKSMVISRQSMTGRNIFLYKTVYRSVDDLISELGQINDQLKNLGGPQQTPLQIAISSVQPIKDTNSLMFFADPETTASLKEILGALDTPLTGAAGALTQSTFLIYKPQYVSPDQIQNALNGLVPTLQETNALADQHLINAIQNMQWNGEMQSFTVTSDPATIERLKELLASIDTQQPATSGLTRGFYLYKLKATDCDVVIDQLKNVAQKLPTNSLQNQNLVNAINKIECIKAHNALLITGSPDAIDQIKTLVAEFDTGVKAQPVGAQTFLIYKPKFLPPEEIEAALTDLASDLESSGLSDPQLFQAVKSMRYVPQTNSLLFTGSQEGLDKVQNLLSTIDSSAALGAIQRIGNLTFFLYKIQSATPDKLISSLKAFAQDLKQSNIEDKELADTINGVRWIKETNSLLFTGNAQTLEKIEELVKKFDLPSLGGPAPIERAATTFVIYNPKYVAGDELISIVCDFMQNLMTSGVSDPGLFDAINNLKWIPKTSSLLISGDQLSVDKVQQLLVKFDIPGKETAPPSIESIDNTSFLVYKLQFHPGNDIQTALKQVALSIGKNTSAPTALVDAINSLQWIQVTNSLLVSGQQDVLVKLKDLIQNLDVPLRQVFIEVLVIETTLLNTQNFGLMWGGQAQYFNKATLGTGNFPISTNSNGNTGGNTTPASTFSPTLHGINATNTPKGGQVPFVNGFDLGVIGDIIMHKGRSFISLGALVNAIQLDTDSTIVLNPKIVTQDNRQSVIFVGQNVPYTGSLVTNQQANTTQTANLEYRDVGVSLTITPILGDGDVVTLDIVNDISEVVGNAQNAVQNSNVTGILTNHTHMETRVHVPDNYFVALSGMINDSKTHFRTAIPCLGGLPVIGALFSENDRTASKANIIIFVRPQIIKTYAEYKKITEHQEWVYKDNARLPVLKEEFDEGLDLVKTPENE